MLSKRESQRVENRDSTIHCIYICGVVVLRVEGDMVCSRRNHFGLADLNDIIANIYFAYILIYYIGVFGRYNNILLLRYNTRVVSLSYSGA